MITVQSRPFTEKYPVLYSIELNDGTLTTTKKDSADNAAQWLNDNSVTAYYQIQKQPFSIQRKFIDAFTFTRKG